MGTSDKNNRSTSSWTLIIILSSVAIVVEYTETMLFPAMPRIVEDFETTYYYSSWILSGFLITAAVMCPIAGKLSDIFGKKNVLLAIMAIFAGGVVLSSFANSISFLIATRLIQGIGLSTFAVALSIMEFEMPKEKYALAFGIMTATYFGGSTIGLTLGGVITDYFGWRMTFLSLIPIVVILFVLILKFLKIKEDLLPQQDQKQFLRKLKSSSLTTHTNKANRKNSINEQKNYDNIQKHYSIHDVLDIKGAIALAAAVSSFLASLTYISNSGDFSSLALFGGLLILSAISILIFIVQEKSSVSPLIKGSLVLNKVALPAIFMLTIYGMILFILYQTIPVLVTAPSPSGFGGSPVTASFVLLPFTIIFLIMSPAVSIIVSKFGNIRPLIVGSLLCVVGSFGLLFFHSTEFDVSTNLSLLAAGLVLIDTIAFSTIMITTPKEFGGVSIGMVQVLLFGGMSIGPIVAAINLQNHQIIVTTNTSESDSFPSSLSYYHVFLIAALASIVFVTAAMVLKKTLPPNISNPQTKF